MLCIQHSSLQVDLGYTARHVAVHLKLAVCPVSYMDNLQGLYAVCRNTGTNYSNLDRRF